MSCHVVKVEYDHGGIIAQQRVPVVDGDTVATLAARVLEQEHRLLVETPQRIDSGELVLSG
jgi:phosphoribosylglycinamide formyltransferase-1